MLQDLLGVDQQLFSLINNLPHTSFSNVFFSFLSGIGSWGLVWIALGIILVVREELENKKHLIPLIISIIFSLLIAEFGMKNVIQRERPFGGLGTYSFPSSHATIAFSAAYVLSQKHKKFKYLYYLLAVLISFSRTYLGKHYPGDVLAGALLGIIIGYFSIMITKRNKLYDKTKC